MSRKLTRSTSKSRSKSPKASIALAEDSDDAGEGSGAGLIAPRSSGDKLELPKSPDVRPRRPRESSYDHSDEEEEEQAAGAKSKKSRGTPTTQRTTDPSTETSELREKDLNYIMKKTKFPESVIHKWYNLLKDYIVNGPKADYYDAHRRACEHKPQQLCITSKDVTDQIKLAYGKRHEYMASAFKIPDIFDVDCEDFTTFMKQLGKTTVSTDDLDIKLDLMTCMCRDIDDKRARVHKHKLLAMLTAAGDLDWRQQRKVAEDIESIFNSMRLYMPKTDVLEFVHFRRGIKDGEGRLDIDETRAKYYVLTCVPEIVAAMLAIANRSYKKNKDLPSDTLKVISREQDFLERKLADKEAESTLKSESSTGASSSKSAGDTSKKKGLVRTDNWNYKKNKDLPSDTLKVISREQDLLERKLADKEAESTLKSESSTGASSSKSAGGTSKKKGLVRTDSTESSASDASAVSAVRRAMKAMGRLGNRKTESTNVRRSPRKQKK